MTNNLTKHDISSLLKEFEDFLKDKKEEPEEPSLPVGIFSKKLSAFETVVKYLVENLGYEYSRAGRVLKRDRQVIWITYKRASKKYPDKFEVVFSKLNIPLSKLSSKKHSISELVVAYLKELNLKNSSIAKLLERDSRTIWTLYARYKKKNV